MTSGCVPTARARFRTTRYVENARVNAPKSVALTERAIRTPPEKFVKREMPWSNSAQPARPAIRNAPRRIAAGPLATGGVPDGRSRRVTRAAVGERPAIDVDQGGV